MEPKTAQSEYSATVDAIFDNLDRLAAINSYSEKIVDEVYRDLIKLLITLKDTNGADRVYTAVI